MRVRIAHILFSLSSLFKGMGKLILTKEKTIVVDALTLPGWFIIDNCMIHQVGLTSKKSVGFSWHTYAMPDEWVDEMEWLKSKLRG